MRFLVVSKVHPGPGCIEGQYHEVTVIAPLGVNVILLAGIVHVGVPVNIVEYIVKFHPVSPFRSVHQKSGPTQAFPDKDWTRPLEILVQRSIPVAIVQSEIDNPEIFNDNSAVCAFVLFIKNNTPRSSMVTEEMRIKYFHIIRNKNINLR